MLAARLVVKVFIDHKPELVQSRGLSSPSTPTEFIGLQEVNTGLAIVPGDRFQAAFGEVVLDSAGPDMQQYCGLGHCQR